MTDPTQTMMLLTAGMGGGMPPVQIQQSPQAPITADVGREYASGGASFLQMPVCVPPSVPEFDTLYATHGDVLIDWMLTDPVITSSVNTIKDAVLCDGIKFAPAIEPDEDDEDEGKAETPAEKKAAKDDAELAIAIAEFCARMLARLVNTRSLDDVLHEMLDCCMYRDIAAEVVGELCEGGPDDGQAVLKSLNVKPRWAWAYEVDRFTNVVGYRIWNPVKGKSELLPPWKLAVLSWFPAKADPRGTTVARAAFNCWNLKLNNFVQWHKFDKLMAGPSIFATVGPNAQARPQLDPSTGMPTGKMISAEKDMSNNLSVLYASCSHVVAANGATMTLVEAKGDGSSFDRLNNTCDRQMVLAILQATRATLEAQHGSKADSETSQDVVGLVVRMVKSRVAQLVRKVMWIFVAARWTEAVANRLTPKVQLGDTDHQDFASYANAIAHLAQAGLTDESQRPAIFQWLGLPRAKRRKEVPLTVAQPGQPGQAQPKGQPQGKPKPAPGSASTGV